MTAYDVGDTAVGNETYTFPLFPGLQQGLIDKSMGLD